MSCNMRVAHGLHSQRRKSLQACALRGSTWLGARINLRQPRCIGRARACAVCLMYIPFRIFMAGCKLIRSRTLATHHFITPYRTHAWHGKVRVGFGASTRESHPVGQRSADGRPTSSAHPQNGSNLTVTVAAAGAATCTARKMSSANCKTNINLMGHEIPEQCAELKRTQHKTHTRTHSRSHGRMLGEKPSR